MIRKSFPRNFPKVRPMYMCPKCALSTCWYKPYVVSKEVCVGRSLGTYEYIDIWKSASSSFGHFYSTRLIISDIYVLRRECEKKSSQKLPIEVIENNNGETRGRDFRCSA